MPKSKKLQKVLIKALKNTEKELKDPNILKRDGKQSIGFAMITPLIIDLETE